MTWRGRYSTHLGTLPSILGPQTLTVNLAQSQRHASAHVHPHPCTIFEPDAAQCHRAAFSKPCSDNRGCDTSAVEPGCDLFASCLRDLCGLRDESSMSKSRPNFRILRANVSCSHAQIYDDHIASLYSSRLGERGNQQRGRAFHIRGKMGG
jgi:hypothetical protein